MTHFEWVHLENIERSALEETKIIRQTVKYKGGEILNGQLKDGKVKSATIVSKFRPPKAEASMWLLARRFPERWGPQAKGAAHEGKAPDRRATVIFYKLDKNGRVCDLVLPSDPHFSSEMLKAPDVLPESSEGAIGGGSSSRRVRAFASDCIESVCAPPIAEHPWPNHGGGQRWSLTRSPLRRTVPPLLPRVPTIMMMKDSQPIHRWVLPQSSVGGRRVTCSRARVLA